MNKKRVFLKAFVLAFFFSCLFVSAQLSTYPYSVVVTPKNSSGDVQKSTAFTYSFILSNDTSCSVLINETMTITTDKYGVGGALLNTSNLTSIPSYICTYKDGVIQDVRLVNRNQFMNVSDTDILGFGFNKTVQLDDRFYPLSSNPNGYLTSYAETDPVWISQKTAYTLLSQLPGAVGQNLTYALVSANIGNWSSDKTSYSTTSAANLLYYPRNTNPQGFYNTSTIPAYALDARVTALNTSANIGLLGFNTTADLDRRYIELNGTYTSGDLCEYNALLGEIICDVVVPVDTNSGYTQWRLNVSNNETAVTNNTKIIFLAGAGMNLGFSGNNVTLISTITQYTDALAVSAAYTNLGNWSNDKSSYYTITSVNNIVAGQNNLSLSAISTNLGNWSNDKASYTLLSQLPGAVGQNLTYALVSANIGNWSLDKTSYSTTTIGNQNWLNVNSGGWINTSSSLLVLNNNASNISIDTGTIFVNTQANKVGIGNSAPGAVLEVTGTVNATGYKQGTNNLLIDSGFDAGNITSGTVATARLPTLAPINGMYLTFGGNDSTLTNEINCGTMVCLTEGFFYRNVNTSYYAYGAETVELNGLFAGRWGVHAFNTTAVAASYTGFNILGNPTTITALYNASKTRIFETNVQLSKTTQERVFCGLFSTSTALNFNTTNNIIGFVYNSTNTNWQFATCSNSVCNMTNSSVAAGTTWTKLRFQRPAGTQYFEAYINDALVANHTITNATTSIPQGNVMSVLGCAGVTQAAAALGLYVDNMQFAAEK